MQGSTPNPLWGVIPPQWCADPVLGIPVACPQPTPLTWAEGWKQAKGCVAAWQERAPFLPLSLAASLLEQLLLLLPTTSRQEFIYWAPLKPPRYKHNKNHSLWWLKQRNTMLINCGFLEKRHLNHPGLRFYFHPGKLTLQRSQSTHLCAGASQPPFWAPTETTTWLVPAFTSSPHKFMLSEPPSTPVMN